MPGQRDVPQGERGTAVVTEVIVRHHLRDEVLATAPPTAEAVYEFWVPRSNERADVVVIGATMDGFEIKSDRDTLRRLPRQAPAYGRLFDRCTVVVAERHAAAAEQMLPDWWGLTVVHVNGSVSFTTLRKPKANCGIDPEILVRLLWRDEAAAALLVIGRQPDPKASRLSLWRELLEICSLTQLRRLVRHALLRRDPAQARIATRRFTAAQLAAGATDQ